MLLTLSAWISIHLTVTNQIHSPYIIYVYVSTILIF